MVQAYLIRVRVDRGEVGALSDAGGLRLGLGERARHADVGRAAAATVMLSGLARRTARQIEEALLFYPQALGSPLFHFS